MTDTTGIQWRSDFVDALEGMHPNTTVKAAQVSDKAGHLAHEWRAMQAEATRLAEENARLYAIIEKLTR